MPRIESEPSGFLGRLKNSRNVNKINCGRTKGTTMGARKKQKVPVDRKNIILKTLDSHLHMSNATTPKWIRLGKQHKKKKKTEKEKENAIQRKGQRKG